MHLFFRSSASHRSRPPTTAPPGWSPAPETSHRFGLLNEAPEQDFEAAKDFCKRYPLDPPRLLPSNVVERIRTIGCKVWGLETPQLTRFIGKIRNPIEDSKTKDDAVVHVETSPKCGDTCILSNYPIGAALYDTQGQKGAYYEVRIVEMNAGFIAVGTACRPYPEYRLPGWNRLSAGLHLDDMHKFFEDPAGGRDYVSFQVRSGDTIGCGYEYQTGVLFYTYNGKRQPNAFTGVYLPHTKQDVYAAVGVSGAVKIKVNFGGDSFLWSEGNEGPWKVDRQVGGNLGAIEGEDSEVLPSYQAIAR